MATIDPPALGIRQSVVDSFSKKLPTPVMLYLLCIVMPIWFNAGPLKMSSLRLFLIVMLIPLMVNLFSGKYGRLILTDFLFVLHVIWMAVALYVNSPGQMVTQVGSVGMEFLGGYLVARAFIRSPEAFIALCRWIVLLVLILSPLAIYETLTGKPPIVQAIRALPGVFSIPIVDIDKRLGLERVQAVFAHPIHFGLFCSVSVAMTFVAMNGFFTGFKRFFLAIFSGATGFLALSSGAFLAICLQCALIGWSWVFRRIHWRWWLLVAMFALAYVVIDILSNRSPIKVFMSYATFSAHNAYWRSIIFEWGMKNVWANPIFGLGMNDWVRPHFMYSGSMDNFWLVMAVRFGIPGFLFLAVGYAWAIFLIMRRKFDNDFALANIRRAWVFTFLGLSFTLVTVHVWATIYSFVFFMFGAGIWLVNAQTEDQDPNTSAQDNQEDDTPSGRRFSRYPVTPRASTRAEPSQTFAYQRQQTQNTRKRSL